MSISMATRVLDIPVLGSRYTPEFDLRNPEKLKEFLEEFEELAERHGLTTKEKAKIVVKYVNKETKKFWKRLEDFGDNYMILKRKIMGTYSKTLLEDKLTVAKLVKLVKKSAKGSIADEEDLDIYYRKSVTNFIQSYLHQFFDYSHSLKASLKLLRRPFN